MIRNRLIESSITVLVLIFLGNIAPETEIGSNTIELQTYTVVPFGSRRMIEPLVLTLRGYSVAGHPAKS